MKALLLKDFYMMKKQLRIYVAVMIIYAVLFVPQGMADMLAFMSVMFCMMSVITAMSFDETLKWDRYALSGPVSRGDVVRGKYALSGLLMLIGFCFGALCYLLLPLFNIGPRSLGESLTALCGGCLAGLLMLSFIIPFIYKLGVEKARLLLIGSVLLPVGVVVIYSRYAPMGLKSWLMQFTNLLPFALLVFTLVAAYVSYKISLRIFTNKDF